MSIQTNITGATNFALQAAIGAYSDEAYTSAKKLSGTGIVGSNPDIDVNTETFIGQVRWYKPLNPTINVASLNTATDGTKTTFTSDFLTYVKTVRTHGASKVNMQQVITQVDGLAKIGRDFAETRAQDEHNAILSILKGVATAEILNGTANGSGNGAVGLGGQTFTNDPTDKKYGFYVDFGTSKLIQNAGGAAGTNAAISGAARADNFLEALGRAWKDYEPEYAYLVTSPAVLASLRSSNLVDEVGIADGNIMFQTLFGGKFRLIQTRATQSFTGAELTKLDSGAGVALGSLTAYTSFIVLPGAIAMETMNIPDSTEVYRNANTYNGGGSTDIWHRWGYVAHPAGYNWAGGANYFPSDADYTSVLKIDGSKGQLATAGLLSGDGTTLNSTLGDTGSNLTNNAAAASATGSVKGVWERKATSALSLGILPILHS